MFIRITKQNFYKLLCSRSCLLMMIGCIVAALFINSFSSLYTKAYISRQLEAMPADMVLVSMGLDGSLIAEGAEPIDIILSAQMPDVFVACSNGIEWISLVFLSFFVCMDFREGSFSGPLRQGSGRASLFLSKWLFYLFLFWFETMLILLIMLLRFTAMGSLNTRDLFRNLGIFTLIMLSHGALCSMSAMVFRTPLGSGLTILVLTILERLLTMKAPLWFLDTIALWSADANASLIHAATLSSVIVLILCSVAAYIILKVKKVPEMRDASELLCRELTISQNIRLQSFLCEKPITKDDISRIREKLDITPNQVGNPRLSLCSAELRKKCALAVAALAQRT